MVAIEVIFWGAALLLFWVYAGYPLFLRAVAIVRPLRMGWDTRFEPTVSLVIAAYNEEAVIEEKIQNSLALDYPKGKLEIIVFSDGSTDATDDIVSRYAERGVRLLRIEGRKGKTYSQNEAVKMAQGDILVFSDANSMYEPDAIRKLVRHFADPRIGCVSGELRYRRGVDETVGEGVYWRYEQALKRLESRVSSLVTANGAIYAVRRDLYVPLPAAAISDFVEPLLIVKSGYRVVHEEEAVAWERTASDAWAEYRRRTRIVARSAFSLFRDRAVAALLDPSRYGMFSVQLWFHKVLRWFSGAFLVLVFGLNIALVGKALVYQVTLAGQVAFYALAIWGLIEDRCRKRAALRVPHFAYYFCLSCCGMLRGVSRGLRGRTMVVWSTER